MLKRWIDGGALCRNFNWYLSISTISCQRAFLRFINGWQSPWGQARPTRSGQGLRGVREIPDRSSRTKRDFACRRSFRWKSWLDKKAVKRGCAESVVHYVCAYRDTVTKINVDLSEYLPLLVRHKELCILLQPRKCVLFSFLVVFVRTRIPRISSIKNKHRNVVIYPKTRNYGLIVSPGVRRTSWKRRSSLIDSRVRRARTI